MIAANKMYSIIKNTALSIVCIVIFILLFEAVLRYSSYDFYKSDRSIIEGKGNTAKDEKYIITLGDSFSAWKFCWPFKLNTLFSEEKKVVNLAVAGAGPNVYYLTLKKYVEDYKPEQIIIGLYVGNDFWDVKRPVPQNANLLYRVYYFLDNTFISLKWLNKKMGEVKAIFNKKANAIKNDKKTEKGRVASETNPVNNRIHLREIHRRQGKMFPNMYKDAILLDTEFSRAQFDDTMEYIKKITELARKYAAEVALVIIPASCQVSPVYSEFYNISGYEISESMLISDVVQQQIKKYCLEYDIGCIDVLPYLRTLDHSRNPVYYYNDMHMNEVGQTLMAEYIYNELKRLDSWD